MTIHWHAPPPPKAIRIELRIEAAVGADGRQAEQGTSQSGPAAGSTGSCGCLSPSLCCTLPCPLSLVSAPRGFDSHRHAGGAGFELSVPRPAEERAEGKEEGARRPPRKRDLASPLSPSAPLPSPATPASDRRATWSSCPTASSTCCNRRWSRSWPAARLSFAGSRFRSNWKASHFVPAAGGHSGRRDGAGQDDAGDHGHSPAAPPRRGAERAAGLSEAVGHELAAGVCRLVAGGADDGHRGPQDKRRWQWQLPDVPVRIANYELLLRDFSGSRGRRDGEGGGKMRSERCPLPILSPSPPAPASTWWCSTNRSGSRTAPARPAGWRARYRGSGVGR